MLAAATSTAPSGFDWATFWEYTGVVLVVAGALAAWIKMSVGTLAARLEPRLASVEQGVSYAHNQLAVITTDVAVLRETTTRAEDTLGDISAKVDRVGSTADRMDGELRVLVAQMGQSPQSSPQAPPGSAEPPRRQPRRREPS